MRDPIELKNRHFKKATSIILLLLAVSLAVAIHPANSSADSDRIYMTYENQLLSLKTRQADIKTILLEISNATGIDVRFPKSLEKKITVELVEIPLAKALTKLVRGLNHAFIYAFIPQENRTRVSKLYIFQKSKDRGTRRYYPNARMQDAMARRIETYEKRIRVLNEQLSRIDPESPRGQRYKRRLQNFQNILDRLRRDYR